MPRTLVVTGSVRRGGSLFWQTKRRRVPRRIAYHAASVYRRALVSRPTRLNDQSRMRRYMGAFTPCCVELMESCSIIIALCQILPAPLSYLTGLQLQTSGVRTRCGHGGA